MYVQIILKKGLIVLEHKKNNKIVKDFQKVTKKTPYSNSFGVLLGFYWERGFGQP